MDKQQKRVNDLVKQFDLMADRNLELEKYILTLITPSTKPQGEQAKELVKQEVIKIYRRAYNNLNNVKNLLLEIIENG